jgi:hypothetical protein
MTADSRYELNNPPVIAELVEGEVIAINLDSGSYYSLLGPAAGIWNLLLEGHAPGEILRGCRVGEADAERGRSLEGFVQALLAEGLIRPRRQAEGTLAALADVETWTADALRFERFTDMQDLLLLDPIHEVDEEMGWPKPAR